WLALQGTDGTLAKILALALGTCVLNDQGALESAVANMVADKDNSLMQTFSIHVSAIIEAATSHSGKGGETFNCIIGWSHCEDHSNMEELISTTDARLLLFLLWCDRERFLQTMAATVSPGLCGVMYVLWRCIIYQRYRQELSAADAKRLMVHYTDILWRSYLSAVANQDEAFHLLHSLNVQGFKSWEDDPKCINPEDSKFIVHIFGHQLLERIGGIVPVDIPKALNFVYLHSIHFTGCEYELPTLFMGVFKRLWGLVLNSGDRPSAATLDIICEAFDWCSKILVSFAARCFGHDDMFVLICRLSDTRISFLLDFIAKVMLLPDPATIETSPDKRSPHERFLIDSGHLCHNLSQIVSKENLLQCFSPYFFEWARYFRHLQFLQWLTTSYGPAPSEYYERCREIWLRIWKSLAKLPEPGLMSCWYPRCMENTYCSPRCQALDWNSAAADGEGCPHTQKSFFAEYEGAKGYGFLL
ncbi:unnamed protein product, partial [Rhizoctonia solani]